MRTFRIALSAFKQPVILASIIILLVNDHVFKVLAPSWVTGKLSDFAGLFFFPFLLAALLAFPLEALGVKSRQAGGLACIITALWFALLKTVAPVNQATEAFAGWLINAPSQITLDPTDLIALPMVGLAWWQWLSLEEKYQPQSLGWVSFAILSIGAFATLATSCAIDPSVYRLHADGSMIYAGYVGGKGPVYSDDLGKTWQPVTNPPAELDELLQWSANSQVEVCAPEDLRICYRIVGKDYIERTTDRGQTWQVDWRWPEERTEFLRRMGGYSPMGCASHLYTSTPADLTILPSGQTHVVVAAMGYGGVLIRNSEGEWVRQAVLQATPLSFVAPTFWVAVQLTLTELAICLFFSYLILLISSSLEKSKRLGETEIIHRYIPGHPTGTIIILCGLGLLFVGAIGSEMYFRMSLVSVLFYGVHLIIALFPVILPILAGIFGLGSLVVGVRMLWLIRQSKTIIEQQRQWGILLAGLISLFAFSPFILWSYGVIANYNVAVVMAAFILIPAAIVAIVFACLSDPKSP